MPSRCACASLRRFSLLLLVLLAACAARPRAGEADPVARTLAFGEAFVADKLDDDFRLAANLQPAGARYDQLPDRSLEAIRGRELKLDRWRAELLAIDPARLAGSPAALTRDLVLAALDGNLAARACRRRGMR